MVREGISYFILVPMKNKKDLLRKCFRIASLTGMISLCVIDLIVCGETFSLIHVVASLIFADNLMLLMPVERQSYKVSLIMGAFTLVCSLASSLFQKMVPEMAGLEFRLFIPVAASIMTTQVDGVLKTIGKYRNIRTLFKSAQVLSNIEDQACLQRCLQLYICGVLVYAAHGAGGTPGLLLSLASIVQLTLLFAVLIHPRGFYLFLGKRKFLQVIALIQGRLKDNIVMEESEGRDMAVTYQRAQEYMETCRPYLKQTLSLEELARQLGTNKVYLSRTINVISGRNFCQFVNYYRIQYAKQLMRKNSDSKMIEVALASGFNSVVTFNMAFKLNEDLTPSEWLREYNSV